MKTLRMYAHLLRFGVQNTLAYRVNFFFRAGFNLIPLFTGLALWRAIYSDSTASIAGYTLAQMLSYYLIAALVDALTAPTEDDWQIAAEIKDGHISQFLVKPVGYLAYRLCLFCSGRLIYSLAALIPVGLFLAANRDGLSAPPDLLTLGAFVLSIALSAINQFLLTFLIAILAFWVLEVSSFSFILLAFERLAGGLMFPLDILPSPLKELLLLTPFPSQIYIPVEIYIGRMAGPLMWSMIAQQAFWVAILSIAALSLWNRGVRSYAAVGG